MSLCTLAGGSRAGSVSVLSGNDEGLSGSPYPALLFGHSAGRDFVEQHQQVSPFTERKRAGSTDAGSDLRRASSDDDLRFSAAAHQRESRRLHPAASRSLKASTRYSHEIRSASALRLKDNQNSVEE